MGFVDLFIVIFILFGALIGFKQGFTKSLVNFLGYVVIVVLAFVLKNPISEFLMFNLPFFDFYGLIKGISVLNIAVYEIIAFIIVFVVLLIVLKILLVATSVFEKVLTFTIVLGIPSKMLGALIGGLKNYVIVFIVLYILSLPNFANYDVIKNSSLQKPILANTPFLSSFVHESIKVFEEFASLSDKYKETDDSNAFNLETLELFLKYDVVNAEVVEKLVKKDKLHIKGIDKLLEEYKEE